MPQDVFRKIYLTFLLVVAVQPVATSDELILSFEAETTTYIGPELLSPFNPTGYIGSLALANPDLIKLDGQFIVKNFDSRLPGTQTYRLRKEGGSDDGVEMFLHNPLFFRLEAFTTRIGDNSPTGYPENTKILLPRREESETTSEEGVRTAGFFGDATLTVVDGVPESFSYYMGPDSLSSFDYRTVPNRGVSLDELTIQGGSIHLLESFDLGTTAAADVPYGFYSTLEGNPAETVLKTTRGIIQAELDDNNFLDIS